jgi:PKD repeat protein
MTAIFDKKRSSKHSACSDVTHLAGVTSCLLSDCALSVGISLRPEKVETTVKPANRKGVRLGLVAALAATGLVGVTSLTASGQTSPPQEVVGELVLTVPGGSTRTATVEVFFLDENGDRLGPAVATQNFTATAACPTLESTGDSVLEISATPAGIPVLPNNGIGVTDNTSCGASGAVVKGEALSLALLNDTLTGLFGGDVDVRGGSITVFRDPGGGNLEVGFDGKGVAPGGNLVNGLNPARTFTGWFEDSIQISSSSTNANKGIYLRGATFTLVRDIQNEAPIALFTPTVRLAPEVRTVDFVDESFDPDGTVVKWEWDFGDNTPTSTRTINRTETVINGNTSYTYSADGTYPVKLTVTDNLGRKSTEFMDDVNIVNTAPTARFTPTVRLAPEVRTVDFVDESFDPDGTVVKWEWDFGDNTPTSTRTINRTETVINGNTSYTYSADGTYPVKLTVTDNLGRKSTEFMDDVNIVNTAPTALFTWDATTLTVDFLDASSDPDGTVDTWEWNFGDNTPTRTINRSSEVTNGDTFYTYSADGTYPVTLTVTDNLGRKSTAFEDEVTVTGTAVFCSRDVSDGTESDIASATFLRGENGTKFSAPCDDVGVIVDVVNSDPIYPEGYVFFDNAFKGLDGSDQDVNGLVTIKWQLIDPANSDEVARMNNRKIDYDGFEPGIGPKTQSYCLSFDQTFGVDEFGEETFTFNVLLPDWPWIDEPGFILVNGVPKVPWCLVSDTRVVDESGFITQTEVLFGRGDPIKPK